jgi:CRP/FNR family cyclic AMP-dependent transcriptional regulator
VETLAPGSWSPDRAEPEGRHLGLLVLEGLISRELVVGGASSIELLSQGDLLRPWQEDTASFCDPSWRCLTEVPIASLDGDAAEAISRYPELVSALIERALRRSRSLAIHAAIETIVGLDRRLILLFWHLAEHWGRRDPEGVVVPLPLTHEMLASLIGARRPSVTAALGELARAGKAARREGGGWILYGDPPGVSLELPAEGPATLR